MSNSAAAKLARPGFRWGLAGLGAWAVAAKWHPLGYVAAKLSLIQRIVRVSLRRGVGHSAFVPGAGCPSPVGRARDAAFPRVGRL